MFPIQPSRNIKEELFSNKALLLLVIPLVLEQFLAILLGTVDMMMVSSISEGAVSGISLVDSINVLFAQLFTAMGTGGAVVAAQYLGKQEPLHACQAAKQLLYVSLFISLLVMGIALAFCDDILRLCFGVLPAETQQYCRDYLYLSALSYPALALYSAGAGLLRAMGDSKSSMLTALLMNLINIVGNWFFIFILGMEVTGAGLSTLLSRLMGAIVVLRLLLSPDGAIHIINPLHYRFDMVMVKRILRIGIPNGLENSIFQIGKLLVVGLVSTLGVSMIAANAVANNISSMANIPGSAIGLAMITVVGQCIGAGDGAQAKRYSGKLLKAAYCAYAVMALILLLFARPFVLLFSLSPEGVDAAVRVLRLYALAGALAWPASFTLPNCLRAAGDAKFTMAISVLSMWVFRIGFSYLLVNHLGMQLLGIWVAMYIDWFVRGAIFLWRYQSGKWLDKRVV